MGIITRIRRILGANIHEALDRAENPARMLNYLIVEMQESLQQAREEVATAMAAERRLAEQATEAVQAAAQWEQRARRAVGYGSDDLAREALRRRGAAMEMAEHYQRAHAEQEQAVAQLRSSLVALEHRLEEAKVRRMQLLGQLQTAQAQDTVARAFQQSIGAEAFDTFDRIALQVNSSQHRSAALLQLSQHDLEDAFAVAEEAGAIEHQLREIKREMGALSGPPPQAALEQQADDEGKAD